MNVIIANEHQNELSNLDVDVIKNINGVYDVNEVVEMFKNFFYSKMILDVTALKNCGDLRTYEKLVHGLEADKIIFLLPEGSKLCTSNFLGHLISIGIYNFTTNMNGVSYLLKKSNTLKDVEHILKMSNVGEDEPSAGGDGVSDSTNGSSGLQSTRMGTGPIKSAVIGVRNVTDGAGATTFVYMLKKELAHVYGQNNVLAIEIDKNDFSLFNDKRMISIKQSEIKAVMSKYTNVNIIIFDLNQCSDDSFCGEVLYLLEPSTIKLNRLVRKNREVFTKLGRKKIVLNRSLLLNNDVFDFESEAGIKVFYNMPPLDERKRNAIINDFLSKLGILSSNNGSGSNKIFGLFRR